ncbi:MAG: hypothetical protein LBC21_01530 [Oscillospiraceae bacterium]|jgi:hypothetical protein|nr:hypothetical protein [Oscillospiraceae bacterium]
METGEKMKLKNKAALALALIAVFALATTTALADPEKPSTTDATGTSEPTDTGESPEETGTEDGAGKDGDDDTVGEVVPPAFERGVVLRTNADFNNEWEFETTEDTNKRTFKLINVDGRLQLSYQGKSSSGDDYGNPVAVYLEVHETTPSADSIRIEYMDESGEKGYRDVTLEEGNVKVTPIRFDGTNVIKDVLIPRECLVEEQNDSEHGQINTDADASATSDNAGDGIEDGEDNEKDDNDMIIIEIPIDDLKDFIKEKKVDVELNYKSNTWKYVDIAEKNTSEPDDGEGTMIKLAWIALIAVSLVSVAVNVMIMLAKNNKGARR